MYMSKKLHVGSLAYSVNSKVLESIFSVVGRVISANIVINTETGRGKGFGFVEMSTDEEARQAVLQLNGNVHGGRKIVVTLSKSVSKGKKGGSRGRMGRLSGGVNRSSVVSRGKRELVR